MQFAFTGSESCGGPLPLEEVVCIVYVVCVHALAVTSNVNGVSDIRVLMAARIQSGHPALPGKLILACYQDIYSYNSLCMIS